MLVQRPVHLRRVQRRSLLLLIQVRHLQRYRGLHVVRGKRLPHRWHVLRRQGQRWHLLCRRLVHVRHLYQRSMLSVQHLRNMHLGAMHLLRSEPLPQRRAVLQRQGQRRHVLRCRLVHVWDLHQRSLLCVQHLRNLHFWSLHLLRSEPLPQWRAVLQRQGQRQHVHVQRHVHEQPMHSRAVLPVRGLHSLHDGRMHLLPVERVPERRPVLR
jgi:hypothetical protein